MFIRIMQPPDCFNKGKSAPFFISLFVFPVVTAYLLYPERHDAEGKIGILQHGESQWCVLGGFNWRK